MSTLPNVLSPAELPSPELQAARLDGELVPACTGFAVIDEPEVPGRRLGAVLAGRSRRIIAGFDTAVWVWGLADAPPHPLELCVDLGARARLLFDPGATIREVAIDPDEVAAFDGRRVTTPLRTLTDLARSRELDHGVARSLARLGGLDLDACLRALDRRRNLPGKRIAITRLRAALGG